MAPEIYDEIVNSICYLSDEELVMLMNEITAEVEARLTAGESE